jgi:hypothetical protein
MPLLKNQQGSALVMAAIFMVLATTLMVTAGTMVKTARNDANEQAYAVALAENAAQAGLEDAIGWYKRQIIQPVAANASAVTTVTYPVTYNSMAVSYADEVFFPLYNTANPVTTDTIDPYAESVSGIGLVNEFSPDGAGSVSEATTIGDERIWERYEVQRQLPGTVIANAVHDVTGNRVYNGYAGQGVVWSLSSTGYAYYRRDYTKSVSAPYYWTVPYNQSPNKVMASARMTTEIHKLSENQPWGVNAAFYTPNINNLHITGNSNITNENQANSTAWAAAAVSGTSNIPATTQTGEIVGSGFVTTGAGGNGPSINLSASDVFGLSVTDLINSPMVDVSGGTGNEPNFPNLGINQFIVYNGSLTINPDGSDNACTAIGPNGVQIGVLVVNGNFTMESSATGMNLYYGVVYVTGAVTLIGSSINGVLIMDPASGGNVSLSTLNGYTAAIIYNPSKLQTLQSTVFMYKEDVASRRKFLAIPGM